MLLVAAAEAAGGHDRRAFQRNLLPATPPFGYTAAETPGPAESLALPSIGRAAKHRPQAAGIRANRRLASRLQPHSPSSPQSLAAISADTRPACECRLLAAG